MADESTIVDEIIDKKPEPSPGIIEQLKKEEKAVEEPEAENTPVTRVEPLPANEFGFQVVAPNVADATVFDSSIHATDEQGNPKRNADGSFRKKSGRKPGQGQGPRSSRQPGPPLVDNADLEARAAAEVFTSMIFILGTVIGGDEWTPLVKPEIGLNEPESVKNAWYNYFKIVGNVTLPQWVVPLVATGAYVLPRFTMPKTQSRMKRFLTWIKPYFGFKK